LPAQGRDDTLIISMVNRQRRHADIFSNHAPMTYCREM
jgi:hypothetical protein